MVKRQPTKDSTEDEDGDDEITEEGFDVEAKVEQNSTPGKTKFGWIQGVYVPCLLNIWGVMLFLRLESEAFSILDGSIFVLHPTD